MNLNNLNTSVDCKISQQKEFKLVNYEIRKQVNLSYYPYINVFPFSVFNIYDGSLWFSPYQMFSQVLSIQIPKIQIKQTDFSVQKWQGLINKFETMGVIKQKGNINIIKINVNLMDFQIDRLDLKTNRIISSRKDDTIKLQIRQQPMLGDYGLANKNIEVHYTNQSYLQYFTNQIKLKQVQYYKNHCIARLLFSNPKKFFIKEQLKQNNQRNNQIESRPSVDTQRRLSYQISNNPRPLIQIQDRHSRAKLMIQKAHNEQLKINKQISFINAHFVLPIYRYPLVPLLTIFIRLWFMSILNLGIYLTSTNFTYRLGTLVGLLFNYISLIPVYKSQLPPYPGILFVQILIYLHQISSLLCLLESFWKRNTVQDIISITQAGPLFFISLAISSISLVTLSITFLLHKLRWENTYIYDKDEQFITAKQSKFLNYFLWNNPNCDKHFQEIGMVIPLKQVISRANDRKRSQT